MPTWMMALLGLLAYKAIKGGGLEQHAGRRQSSAAPDPRMADQGGGGLGDILGGMLGGGAARQGCRQVAVVSVTFSAECSVAVRVRRRRWRTWRSAGRLLGGGAAGGVLNGGLRKMIEDMQNNGQGDAAKSWVGSGENQHVDPNDLANAIGLDDIDAVAQQTGMPREQLLSELSQHLPEFVDQLTPDGRLPTDDEANSRWV